MSLVYALFDTKDWTLDREQYLLFFLSNFIQNLHSNMPNAQIWTASLKAIQCDLMICQFRYQGGLTTKVVVKNSFTSIKMGVLLWSEKACQRNTIKIGLFEFPFLLFDYISWPQIHFLCHQDKTISLPILFTMKMPKAATLKRMKQWQEILIC